MTIRADFTFTSESVSAAHPDKLCDQISDAILDHLLSEDPTSRTAIETLAVADHVTIAGEFRTSGNFTSEVAEKIARNVIEDAGYTGLGSNFDAHTCEFNIRLTGQSPEIAEMADDGGAGDQGLMFGYARNDNDALMPMPIWIAHRLIERIDTLRLTRELPYLRPDGKSQVTIRYANGRPVAVTRLVVAVPHDPSTTKATVAQDLRNAAVLPLLDSLELDHSELLRDGNYIVNGSGDWTFGGPAADAGLTGRKIIVDTYGGFARHGGGAFSGKDATKVDRSAAYMARYVAKNIVAAGLARECEIQVAYAIGLQQPLALEVNTFGTGSLPDDQLQSIIRDRFDFSPRGIIERLNLRQPIFRKTAAYGHFGRNEFPWEKTDATELQSAVHDISLAEVRG